MFRQHAVRQSTDALGFGLVLLNLEFLGFHGLANVLDHAKHLLHFRSHCLNLLVCSLQRWVFVGFSQQIGVNRLLKTLGHFLRTGPVHVLDEQIACHSPQRWVALQNLRHCVHCFLTLGQVAGACRDNHVVFTNGGVVDFVDNDVVFVSNLAHGFFLHWVNFDHVSRTIDANNPGNALGVVDFRDDVNQLTSDITNGSGQVVNVVVSSGVCLTLTGHNGTARTLVAGGTKAGIVLACGRFNVVRSAHFGLNQTCLGQWWLCALRQRQNVTLPVSYIRVDLEVGPVVRVGCFPLVLVAFKLTTVANKRRFGCQSQHLGFLANPVVVHALGVFGVTHKARQVHTAFNLKLVTDDANNRNPFTSPFLFLKHLVAVGFDPLDALAIGVTAAQRLAKHHAKRTIFGGVVKRCLVVGVQV